VVIVGLAGHAVRESAERVRSAIQQAGFEFPRKRVVVNLAPADLPKSGTAFDLPIAIGVLAAAGLLPSEPLEGTAMVGELSLEGHLRDVRGALSLALMAQAQGLKRLVLPRGCAAQASLVSGLEVLEAGSLAEVCAWMSGQAELGRPEAQRGPPEAPGLDLAEVRGQARARRALEVAAAGGHNLMMVGPPGCGKTMLAARLPTVLPPLSFEEAVDITRVHSVAGLLPPGQAMVQRRPFRAPHHSVTAAGMVGNAALLPGEISLAHQGVLFLDELPEFSRHVLELLRAPLEDREIRLTRASGTVRFPASFSLIAAANPCPCGFQGHPLRPCACPPGAIERYRARMSGPLMDRIDLQVWVQPVEPDQLVRGSPGESSAVVRERVEAARARQQRRYGAGGPGSNAELTGDAIRQAADPTAAALEALRQTMDSHALSARAWSRILKVARTLADLGGAERVDVPHVLEAASFRLQLAGGAP
jgi:magnesium chelatase family protein